MRIHASSYHPLKRLACFAVMALAATALSGCYAPNQGVKPDPDVCPVPAGGAGVYVAWPESPVLGGRTDALHVSAQALASDLNDEGIDNATAATKPSTNAQALASAQLANADFLLTITPRNWKRPARMWRFDPSLAHFRVKVQRVPSGRVVRTDKVEVEVSLLEMQTLAVDDEVLDDAWSDYAEDIADSEDSQALCPTR